MSEAKPKITKKKLKELAELLGHAYEFPNTKAFQKRWTERRQENWDAQTEALIKECEEAGLFDEAGEIKEEFMPAYRKGIRYAHKL